MFKFAAGQVWCCSVLWVFYILRSRWCLFNSKPSLLTLIKLLSFPQGSEPSIFLSLGNKRRDEECEEELWTISHFYPLHS